MSGVSGHYEITKRAVQELLREMPRDFIVQRLGIDYAYAEPSTNDYNRQWFLDGPHRNMVIKIGGEVGAEKVDPWKPGFTHDHEFLVEMCRVTQNPADGSVCMDLHDLIDGEHWVDTDDSQRHHFMRASHSSIERAYSCAVDWIWQNTTIASVNLAARWRKFGGQSMNAWGIPSKAMGAAVHCLQDSFSGSHVRREGLTAATPGWITAIYVYSEQKASDHAIDDKAWLDKKTKDFSAHGRHAIEATKELLRMTVRAAEGTGVVLEHSPEWKKFCQTWLALKPS